MKNGRLIKDVKYDNGNKVAKAGTLTKICKYHDEYFAKIDGYIDVKPDEFEYYEPVNQ